MRRLLLSSLALTVVSCVRHAPDQVPSRPPGSAGVVLFITSDLKGYLAPCGCSENMRGGIDRAAAQVQAARASGLPVVVLDAGDALFGRPALDEAEVPQEERKAQALARALETLGVAAKAVGPLDEVRGQAFLESLRLPLLRAGEGRTLAVGGVTLGLAAGRSAEALAAAARKVRGAGARLVVGLWTGGLRDAQALAETRAPGVDLLVAAHAPDEGAEANVLTRTPVPLVVLEDKGRSLLRVDAFFDPTPGPFQLLKGRDEAEREERALTLRLELLNRRLREPGISDEMKALLKAKARDIVERRQALTTAAVTPAEQGNRLLVRFIPLEASLPSDPAVHALVQRYDLEVAEVNLAWARAHGEECRPAVKGEAAYVGNEACRECHEEAFGVYEATRHARAYRSLAAQGKQFRLDCVRCHVTGFQKPGGVCRVDRVAGREGVGCESCHGPGSLHVADPSSDDIRRAPGKETCLGCHDPENSPAFEVELFLPKVLGPGHGKERP